MAMSSCEYCKQMAPTCNKQMNTFHGYPINFVLGYCIAAAPDPARDYWCANHSIETQATSPRLNQPRVNFLQCM